MIFLIYPTLLVMRTLAEIALFLRGRAKQASLTQRELGAQAGIARATLTAVLSGESDYKVTTLFAVLDRLGYQMTFVPKGAAAGFPDEASFTPTQPAVKTRIQFVRERLKPESGKS